MPLIATRGASSVQGFGQFAQASAPVYIEDVFSTYLINLPAGAGNQQIPHGLDFSTYGGLTWVKNRDAGYGHTLGTTSIGTSKMLFTDTTDAATSAASFVSFDVNGTTITRAGGYFGNSNEAAVSWNFRKQPKFFDVVTYTGNGTTQAIPHSLGATPGMVIVKRTSSTGNWYTWHRSADTGYFWLNSSNALSTTAAANAFGTGTIVVNPTSTNFTVGGFNDVNASGGTYVAYLFAHDAGGFGLTGLDNVISCGSYTGTGALQTINLGYEPQWLLVKRSNSATGGDWGMFDIMRGMTAANASGNANLLYANTSDAEAFIVGFSPIATGFQTPAGNNFNLSGGTYIYMAIRRGPMKVPTLGTSVFTPIARAGTGADAVVTGAGFPVDLVWIKDRTTTYGNQDYDRLRGAGVRLGTYGTFGDQINATNGLSSFASMDGFSLGSDSTNIGVNRSGASDNFINWCFRRAPGFFDIVCYTASAYNDFIYHNLGVAPEMIIAKNRGATTTQWYIYHVGLGVGFEIYFNTTGKSSGYTWITTSTYWNNDSALYPLGESHVAYLFATLAGVSKVGSYTGTGTTKQIDCGFTAGARFVLIKRTDTTGDWYVWDTTRGIISGNDPYLLLNSTAAEATSTDYIDTYNAGFEISSTAPAAINANAGTFIFLAIA